MTSAHAGRTCVAVAISIGVAALIQLAAHAQPQSAGTAPSTPQERTVPAEQVTVTGCIQREADYRRARDAGRGGAAGTGAGAGNEFVLVNASKMGTGSGATGTTGTPTGTPTGTTGTPAGTPAGTAGAPATGPAYELTGANESQAEQYVGRRVEVSGKLKAAEVESGRPTGGASAGKPPEGIEVTGQDLKLRELEVMTIREVPGTCPAA